MRMKENSLTEKEEKKGKNCNENGRQGRYLNKREKTKRTSRIMRRRAEKQLTGGKKGE